MNTLAVSYTEREALTLADFLLAQAPRQQSLELRVQLSHMADRLLIAIERERVAQIMLIESRVDHGIIETSRGLEQRR